MEVEIVAGALLLGGCVLPNPGFDEPSQGATATIMDVSSSVASTMTSTGPTSTTTEPTTGPTTTEPTTTEPTTTEPTTTEPTTATGETTGVVECWERGTCEAEAEWALHYPRTHDNERVLLAPFTDGSIAAVGSFTGTLSLGGLEVKTGAEEAIYLARISASGEVLWLKDFAGLELNHVFDLAIDDSDRIHLAGFYFDKLDLGGGALIGGFNAEAFYAILTGDGGYVFARGYSGELNQYATAIRPYGQDVIIAGHYDGFLDLGNGTLTEPKLGQWNIFVARLNDEGKLLWSFDAGATDKPARVRGIELDDAGNVYAVGSFAGTIELAGSQTALGMADGYVAKFNSAGKPMWFRGIGSVGRAQGIGDVELDADGNVWVTGTCTGVAELGGLMVACGSDTDGFIAALGPDGDGLWARRFGASGFDSGVALSTRAGRGLVLGTFATTASVGGEVHTAKGIQDHLLVELDGASGDALWGQRAGADNPMGEYENAYDLVAQGPDAFFLSAAFYGEIQLGAAPVEQFGGMHSAIMRASY